MSLTGSLHAVVIHACYGVEFTVGDVTLSAQRTAWSASSAAGGEGLAAPSASPSPLGRVLRVRAGNRVLGDSIASSCGQVRILTSTQARNVSTRSA